MSHRTNQEYLKHEQYKDASNLYARINLHHRFSTNTEDWFRWVFTQLKIQGMADLLELGCGPGMLWKHNLDRISPSWRIHLSDFSTGMLLETRTNNTLPQFSFCTLDAQAIPYKHSTFDLVIANHMLYHIPDRPIAISEIRRVLKSGGHLIAATNGLHHMAEIRDILIQLGPDILSVTDYAFGVNEFTIENGTDQLAPWFDDIQVIPFEDSLEVTDPDPLIAYILSMNVASKLDIKPQQVIALRQYFAKEIISHGSFHVTKSTALFTATKIE
jgi:ubiquinone/menaquinone biosynthesis C-methylase UbiE